MKQTQGVWLVSHHINLDDLIHCVTAPIVRTESAEHVCRFVPGPVRPRPLKPSLLDRFGDWLNRRGGAFS